MFVAVLAVSACGSGSDAPVPQDEEAPALSESAPPGEEQFVRTWQGVLPCSDCVGIQARLTLRRGDDGSQTFELEETYLGAEADNVFTLTGPWRQVRHRGEEGPAVVFRIDPDGADQWFQLQPDGSLELLDAAGQPRPDPIGHRLQRL
ncbi:copper resistance protein NlpE N-terminal domain-containing protein [Arenimonas aestuarii]